MYKSNVGSRCIIGGIFKKKVGRRESITTRRVAISDVKRSKLQSRGIQSQLPHAF